MCVIFGYMRARAPAMVVTLLGEYHITWVDSWRLKGEEILLMPELSLLCKKMRDRESERGFACICLAGKKSEGFCMF